MRKHVGRVGAVVAAAAMGLAVSPAIASAADADPGQRTGQVQWWAEGNADCEVRFDILNQSNSNGYVIDFLVDGEDPSEITDGTEGQTGKNYQFKFDGVDIDRTVGRIGVASDAKEPRYGDTIDGVKTGYKWDFEAVPSDNTVSLRGLKVPNAGADKHTVTYRMIKGPDSRHKGWDSEKKEFPEFETEVTGCADPVVPDSGSMGSGFGSLFGSLGSTDPAPVTN